MNFNEPEYTWVFPTKESAQTFRDRLTAHNSIRLAMRKVAVRKALPEYKNGASKGWSVFFTCLGIMDSNEACKLAIELGGRRWGNQ